MKTCRRNLALVAVMLGALNGIAPTPAIAESLAFVGDQHRHFADTFQHSTLEHEFIIRNTATQPITIVEGIAVSGTGQISFNTSPILPGAFARIQTTQPVGTHLGKTTFRFAIVTDEPGQPKHRFSLSGFVQSAYDPETVRVDLGFIDRRRSTHREFDLHSREVNQLRLESATTDHQAITVEAIPIGLASEGLGGRVNVAPGLPRGLLLGTASLITNVKPQPRFDITYTANVFDDVVPAENPVSFGLIRAGQEAIKTILVQSRSETPFTISYATNTVGEILNLSWVPCDGTSRGPTPCYRVRFSLSPDQERVTDGTASLHVVDDPEPIPIRVTSWVVSPDTVIKRLEQSAGNQSEGTTK